jgi:hypothetical protein
MDSETSVNDTKDCHPSKNDYRDQLMSYRCDLQSLHRESQADYDKTIVTICSGALVATIGFFEKLPTATPALGVLTAWSFWSLGLICIIASFAGSVQSLSNNIEHLDQHLAKGKKRTYLSKQTIWDRVTLMGNQLSFLFLILGILVFAASIGWGVMNKKEPSNEQTAIDRNTRPQRTTSATSPAPPHTSDERRNGTSDGGKNDSPTSTTATQTIVGPQSK